MQVYEQKMSNQESENFFFNNWNQNDDIHPNQLSGDQSSETFIGSFASSPKSNFFLTVTTLIKTVVGAGILSLPFTISRLGYLFSFIIFAIVLSINQFTCVLLLKCKNLSHHSNYITICLSIFQSKIFKGLISSAILLKNVGICTLQLLIVKQSLRKIIQQSDISSQTFNSFYTQKWFIVLMSSLLLVPLTLVRKIQQLKFFALLGVSGIVIFVVTLIIIFLDKQYQSCKWNAFPSNWGKAVSLIPNVILALTYQVNFFPLFKGLQNSSDKKMTKASFVGLSLCCILYLLVGNIGATLYSCQQQQLDANFLQTIKKQDVKLYLYVMINSGFLLSVFFSFPVMFFGARNNFIALTKMIQLPTNFSHHNQNILVSKIRFTLLTIFLFAVIIGITILVDSLEKVFNIVGSIASNSISLIFPSLFYISLIRRNKQPKTKRYYLSIAIFSIAIPFGVSAIIFQYI